MSIINCKYIIKFLVPFQIYKCMQIVVISYYIRHKAETHENRRFLSTCIEFAENAYAYVLKAPSRS